MAAMVDDPREAMYAKGIALRPLTTDYEKVERQQQLQAARMNIVDDVSTAIEGGANTAVNLYNDFERKTLAGDADPMWDAAAWLDANKDKVPAEGQWRWMQTRNVAEAELLLSDYNEMAEANSLLEKRGGFTSFTAQALAGLVDLDAPLALLSGGTATGIKASLLGTRFGRIAVGAAAGGASNAALMTIDYGVNPHGDWTSIPTAALLGTGLGGFAGLISPREFTKANASLVDEFADQVEHGTPLTDMSARQEFHEDLNPYGSPDAPVVEGRAPQAFTPPADTARAVPGGSSVGAAQNPNTYTDWRAGVADPDELATMEKAKERYSKHKIYEAFDSAWDKVEEAAPGLAKAARVFDRVVSASPLGSVYSKLANSPSYVAKMLAFDLMVSPGGIAANARAAALIKVDYENQLRGIGIPAYVDSYNAWAAKQGKGVLERNMSRDLKAAFDREVALELQARRYDQQIGPRQRNLEVSQAADAHDAWSKRELEINQGREGEGSVLGWEDIQWKSGYMHQRWSGQKMNQLMKQGRITKDGMVGLLSRSYQKMHPDMLPADADVYARALVNRALARAEDINTNLIGILQEDGADFLRQTLTNNGISQAEATKLIEKLTKKGEKRSQQGVTKQRIDVDLREKDAETGIQLLDLIDTGLLQGMARRSRGTSGRAALARKGIYSAQDRDRIIRTVINEQIARRGGVPLSGDDWRSKLDDLLWDEHDLTVDDLEDYFTFFSEGAIGKKYGQQGISAGYSRAMKLTNLALLNGLGLTQLAETGPIIAAFGWEKFLHYAGDSLKSSLGKGDSPLVQELAHMHIFEPEHRLFRDDMTHEMEKQTAQSEFWSTIDHGLNQAARLQGYMTGFYKIKEFQQRIAVTAAADKIMTTLGVISEKPMSAERLAELGLTPDLQRRLQSYIQRGIVEFKRGTSSVTAAPAPKKRGFYQPPDPMATEGILNSDRMYLHRLNFDQWDPRDVEEFTAALNLSAHRHVQKALAGEQSMIFHKDGLMSLFVHLKSFPLLAMTKQTMRHARIADSESIAALTYGLLTAGAVYAAKQAINGNPENAQDPVKLMKGAFGMSNLTGWFPMFTDPVASILGMDNLKFNEYSRGIDSNVITMPAAFPTLNKMANIPGALLSPVTGALGLREKGLDANAINALKATPLMGNYYGFSALLNIGKEENRKWQAEERKKKKEWEKANPGVPMPSTRLPDIIQSLL